MDNLTTQIRETYNISPTLGVAKCPGRPASKKLHSSKRKLTRGIDCHSGAGIFGRVQAELLGARNAFAWYTHNAIQPAKQTVPVKDANCLKCYQDVTQRGYVPMEPQDLGASGGKEAGTNHWHEFLSRWQAISPTAGTCSSCHPGYATTGTADTGFQDFQCTPNVCNACHQMAG